ncbi:glycosyltransferase [Neobacillus drentensis]|uniref:glycosyltransferase n=1 Tax=Neobacillus drentensis TaxID=220684 RepID=UPI001F3D56DC|nr:glycosyltransferase [Neobacillus drentensis]ULT56204.1 glycosyltransferase [Neobacillus drentensis]
MKKRIFIFGNSNFPRGSAKANYIQYLSQALKEAEYDVFVITDINAEFKLQMQEGHLTYNGIKIIPFNVTKIRVLRRLQYHYFLGHILVNILKEYNLTSKDIVLVYSGDLDVNREILKLKRKIGFKSVNIVVEWFPNSYFDSKEREKRYNTYLKDFIPKHDLIFPISSYIENQLIGNRCKSLRLPIMADALEYPVGEKTFNKIKFIFPGNGLMKDSIEVVLKSFSQLTFQEKERVELHLCGIKEEKIKSLLSSLEYDSLKDILIIHKWMHYEELVELYQSMHFLILAREENQMTLANFPSKVPEVMCYGVIPIVSRVGDYTKYYLEDNVNSLIFDGCKIDLCLEKIRKALTMKHEEILNLSLKARECAEKKFDYRNWVGKIHLALESM